MELNGNGGHRRWEQVDREKVVVVMVVARNSLTAVPVASVMSKWPSGDWEREIDDGSTRGDDGGNNTEKRECVSAVVVVVVPPICLRARCRSIVVMDGWDRARERLDWDMIDCASMDWTLDWLTTTLTISVRNTQTIVMGALSTSIDMCTRLEENYKH
jgi:hypothetical protein